MNEKIENKDNHLNVFYGIVLLISMTLLWKLWGIPRDFPFPLSYINRIGLNRISLGIVILYILNKIIKNKSLSVPFPQLKWLLLFFCGIVISFIYNSYDIGAAQLFSMGESDGILTIKSIIIGAGFYLIFFYFYSHKNILDSFLTITLVLAIIFYISMIGGFARELLQIFGSIIIEEKYSYESATNMLRLSFPTMDDNSFGPIAATFGTIGLYKYAVLRKQQKIYMVFLVCFIILSLIVILQTISRSTLIICIVQMGIFILASSNFKLKAFLLGIAGFSAAWLLLSIGMLPGGDIIIALYERFQQIYYNIPIYFGEVSKPANVGYDNFHARILLAMASLPTNFKGWVFGTGGIYKGFVVGIQSKSHVDLTNWISQWGLITIIPMLIYFFSMIFYLLKWDESRLKIDLLPYEREMFFYLRNLGLSLLPGIMFMMLNSPLFFLFWFVQGITASIIIILKKVEKPQSIRS